MLSSAILVSVSLALIISLIPDSFAENPTPHNEWDFDFVDVDVFQDTNNPDKLVIKPTVRYIGSMFQGTVNINAEIIHPDGLITYESGKIKNMSIESERTTAMVEGMTQEGDYTINLIMTPPEEPYLDHVFDRLTLQYTVEKNGLEKEMQTIKEDAFASIIYKIKNPKAFVPSKDAVHVIVNLPEQHIFDTIAIVNELKIIQKIPIDSKEFYLTSDSGFDDLQIHLVKEENLFPMAFAHGLEHDAEHGYIETYKVNKDMCSSLDCLNITIEETEEPFQTWMLLFFLAIAVYPTIKFLKKCKKQFGKPIIEIPPTHQAI